MRTMSNHFPFGIPLFLSILNALIAGFHGSNVQKLIRLMVAESVGREETTKENVNKFVVSNSDFSITKVATIFDTVFASFYS